MINVSNWDEKKLRYEEYWNCTNKTPILHITAPKFGAVYDEILDEEDSDSFWFDPKHIVKGLRRDFSNTYFGGDAFPSVSPSLGPDLLSALIGLEITYNNSSAWVTHKNCPLSEFEDFNITKNNFYYEKIKEMLNYFAKDAKGDDYIVGMVDLNAGMDGVASLIGPDKLCFEMIDNPEEVQRVNNEIFNLYTKLFSELYKITNKYQKGTTNWLPIYSESQWYYITCDFMCMVSDEHLEEFILWEIEKRVNFHDRTLFHLDGENAIRHLDKILKIPNLTGVQVQATPFVHSGKFWIEHIKKIQEYGKCVCIDAIDEEDIRALIENCKPEGLFIRAWFDSEDKAKRVIDMVSEYYSKNYNNKCIKGEAK